MKISQIVKEKRKHLGLTQENIAEYLGVSTPAVSKWENGTTYPDITLLPGLARLSAYKKEIASTGGKLLRNAEIVEIQLNRIFIFNFNTERVLQYQQDYQSYFLILLLTERKYHKDLLRMVIMLKIII